MHPHQVHSLASALKVQMDLAEQRLGGKSPEDLRKIVQEYKSQPFAKRVFAAFFSDQRRVNYLVAEGLLDAMEQTN